MPGGHQNYFCSLPNKKALLGTLSLPSAKTTFKYHQGKVEVFKHEILFIRENFLNEYAF